MSKFFSREYWSKQKESFCDFDREKSIKEKFGNILLVLFVDYIYIAVIINILIALLGQDVFQKWTYWSWASGKDVMGQLQSVLLKSVAISIFFAVVLAPLWEEMAFRVYWFRKKLRKRDKEELLQPEVMAKIGKMPIWDFVVFSSIIFGIAHGGPINILIQGVGGLFLCYIYLLNKRSFWSAVLLHAMYNGGLILFAYIGAKSALAAITAPYWVLFFN